MESKFGKNTQSSANTSSKGMAGYGGKVKTGTPKTKLKSPKPKTTTSSTVDENKKPGKSKEKTERVVHNSKESSQDTLQSKHDEVPTWIKESNRKKSERKEGGESKLQWRKETKKSQRSWSKNKERDYTANTSKYDTTDEKSRKPFGNTFEKKQWSEASERKSSWNKNSVKPGTGFEKSKIGYRGVASPQDQLATPRKSTRTWDDKENAVAPKYKKPTPTWEKKEEISDKKHLKDPTK